VTSAIAAGASCGSDFMVDVIKSVARIPALRDLQAPGR
jgi:hypothetical protein